MFPYNIISLLLLGYICRVRALQNENSKLCHQIGIVEESKRAEITNLKDLYDQQVTYPTSGIIKILYAMFYVYMHSNSFILHIFQIEKLKNALDDMNKYYNQQKYGAEVLLQENEDLKHK